MKDLLSSSIAFGINVLLNLATGVTAARLLGPDGRGELAAIVLWPQLISAIGVALVTDAVIHASAGKSPPYQRIFASAMACGLLLTVPLVIVGLAVESFVYGHYRPEVAVLGRLYLAFVPLTMLATFSAAIFQGSQNFVVWNALGVSVNVGYLSFILLFLAVGGTSVGAFAAASLLANAATLALAIFLLIRRGWAGLKPDPALMKKFLIYGAPIAAANLLLVLGERLDQAVVSQFRGERELGLYVVALGTAGPILGLGAMLGALVLPKVASRESPESRAIVLGRYLRLSIAIAGLATIALIVLAPLLVRILFGAAFLPAASLMQIVILAAVPYVVRRLLGQAFKAHDKTRLVARIELAAVAVGAVSLFALVPWLGVAGAAWAFVAVNLFGTVYSLILARKILGLSAYDLLRPTMEDWRFVLRELALLRQEWLRKVRQ
ncbi:MAG: oligosaccharide flippase family protein [Alphaproteobacteria bacterium]